MEALTLEEASALFQQLPLAIRPATLHPAYVHADARRNSMLRPVHLVFQDGGRCWMHSLHITEVPGTPWRDASSPYGYGGPLCTTEDPSFVEAAWDAYLEWMREQRVVVEYIRFHPALGNERHYGGNVVTSREAISVDLRQGDIATGYATRLRQGLRKADRAGLAYEEAELGHVLGRFARFYRDGMRGIGADRFYLFEDSYFEALAATGRARVGLCRAGNGEWLAAALFLDGEGIREYHLAAAGVAGREVGASSFVLHEGGLAARRRGAQELYLGGGSDARPDNALLFFKSAFSPRRLTYRTGWTVFDGDRYHELEQRFPRERAAHPERPVFHRIV